MRSFYDVTDTNLMKKKKKLNLEITSKYRTLLRVLSCEFYQNFRNNFFEIGWQWMCYFLYFIGLLNTEFTEFRLSLTFFLIEILHILVKNLQSPSIYLLVYLGNNQQK